MSFEELPPGWEVWSEADARCVLAYRPDVFDTNAFPAPCLPTIYLTKGRRSRRPGRHRPAPDDSWYVTLYLEPEIEAESDSFGDREAAVDGAVTLARRFADGGIDYRDCYQVPREDYFGRLDELTGGEP